MISDAWECKNKVLDYGTYFDDFNLRRHFECKHRTFYTSNQCRVPWVPSCSDDISPDRIPTVHLRLTLLKLKMSRISSILEHIGVSTEFKKRQLLCIPESVYKFRHQYGMVTYIHKITSLVVFEKEILTAVLDLVKILINWTVWRIASKAELESSMWDILTK